MKEDIYMIIMMDIIKKKNFTTTIRSTRNMTKLISIAHIENIMIISKLRNLARPEMNGDTGIYQANKSHQVFR